MTYAQPSHSLTETIDDYNSLLLSRPLLVKSINASTTHRTNHTACSELYGRSDRIIANFSLFSLTLIFHKKWVRRREWFPLQNNSIRSHSLSKVSISDSPPPCTPDQNLRNKMCEEYAFVKRPNLQTESSLWMALWQSQKWFTPRLALVCDEKIAVFSVLCCSINQWMWVWLCLPFIFVIVQKHYVTNFTTTLRYFVKLLNFA